MAGDQGDEFEAARLTPDLVTPLSHWALTWSYLPQLPERARPLMGWSVDELLRAPRRVPGGFSLAPRWTWRKTSAAIENRQRERWGMLAPRLRPPREWLRLLEHFPTPKAVRVHLYTPSKSSNVPAALHFVLLLMQGPGSGPLAYGSRRYQVQDQHVEHELLAVKRDAPKGIGSQVIANALAFYRDLGVRTVGLTAGLTAGGAVWPRFGFRPVDANQWSKVKDTIYANAKTLPPEVFAAFPQGPDGLALALDTILDDPEPDAIWNVVDLDPDRVAADAGQLGDSLGGTLLRGSRWKGVLDLTDDVAVGRAREYLEESMRRGRVSPPWRW